MSDLDQMLDQLRAQPVDPRLAEMDDAVMAGLARRREQAVARRSVALAGLMAIGIGWAGSLGPAGPAQAASRPPVIGMSDYAPSQLLGQ